MNNLLIKLFIKNSENVKDDNVRKKYTSLSSGTGIFLNILLFIGKLILGILSFSVAIIADAFNNIADAGSSFITIIGVKLSSRHADKKHPMGHGRLEYITAFIVDILIVLVGFELLKSSVEKIFNPTEIVISNFMLIFLSISILVKIWLFTFHRNIGKKINSQPVLAVSLDSITDALATTLVLVSAIIGKYFNIYIDSYCGILVAGFILFSGIKAGKETIELLVGPSPSKEMVKEIEEFALKYDEVIGIHDVIIHDYGPGRQIISFHAEVSDKSNFSYVHDVIDKIEVDMHNHFGYIVTIHLDPIVVDDPMVDQAKAFCIDVIKKINSSYSLHDFRMTFGGTHTNLIFDLVIPNDDKHDEKEVAQIVSNEISKLRPDCSCVIKVEHDFV